MKINHLRYFILLLILSILSTNTSAQIEKEFSQPKDDCRLWVYWFVMDGYLNKEGITADLEAMAKVGIGGVILLEVNLDKAHGKNEFMSKEWRDCFQHILDETERLKMELTLGSGPGWAGSGGPWIHAENSMLQLISSKTDVKGDVNIVLPKPTPDAPYFGVESLNEQMKKERAEYYKDEFVLAFPKVESNSGIIDSKEKALYVRHPYSSGNGAKPLLKFPKGIDESTVKGLQTSQMLDVTKYMQPDGRLVWKAPAGEWTVFRFGKATTGANTRPAPVPGYGFECSKLDSLAFELHLDNYIKKLIKDSGPKITKEKRAVGWNMLHIDSWEMGGQNWSHNFATEFQKRRGYSIIPFLPVYSGNIVENENVSERFLWDMRMTAQELLLENHAGYLKKVAHENGFGVSIEPYDMNPTADMALGAYADVPMCEFWAEKNGFTTAFSCIQATSIAHTNNKNIVAAEAFTTDWGKTPWMRTPSNLKKQLDWGFALGINRMVFHRYTYQPWKDRYPGMSMGQYGIQYERTQTWWDLSTDWHNYISRCQYLLRQGKPVADILFLNPEGAPTVFEPPVSALNGDVWLPDYKGYRFDGCDPMNLLQNANVENGKVIFPGGMAYSVLVLPNTEYMTPTLLQKINSLLEKGATVMGYAPRKSPSLVNYPQCDQQVKDLALKMWGNDSLPKRIGKGMLFPCTAKDTLNLLPKSQGFNSAVYKGFVPPFVQYSSIAKVLKNLNIKEDFRCNIAYRYNHRKLENGDLYFVSNTLSSAETGICTFRAKGTVSLLNAEDGKEYQAEVLGEDAETTTIKLPMQGNGSIFVLFKNGAKTKNDLPKLPFRTKPTVNIDTKWTVNFDTAWGGPEEVIFDTLTDWSLSDKAGIRNYSGKAIYKTEITLNKKQIKGQTFIDLGEVQEMARVNINGRDLGVTWHTPFRFETTGLWHEGKNTIEIEVANLWKNRMVGDQSLPEDKRFTWSSWNAFKETDNLIPSGLIGPVSIQTNDLTPFVAIPTIIVDKMSIVKPDYATVSMSCSTEKADIYYTLDGTVPTKKSAKYISPFKVYGYSIITAKAFFKGSQSIDFAKIEIDSYDPALNKLNYKYYEGNWNLLPDFSKLTTLKNGTTNFFDFSKIKGREDNFGVQFYGTITIPQAGNYTFYLTSDDGSKLMIDEKVVIVNDGCHGDREISGKANLTAGKHAISIDYFDCANAETLRLEYEFEKKGSRKAIPLRWLKPD